MFDISQTQSVLIEKEKAMFEHMSEQEARKAILDLTAEYCDTFHNKKKAFEEGDRIPYDPQVYDHNEMVKSVDSALEFWLTSGRYTDQFEADLAKYLGFGTAL